MLKKGALYLSAAFTLAAGGDIALRQMLQEKNPLNPAQIETAQEYFGGMIDYSKVRYVEGKFSALQPSKYALTLGNTFYIPEGLIFETKSYIHEMDHVRQNQNDVPNTGILGAIGLWLTHPTYDHTYVVELDSTKTLNDYTMEQQAKIVERCYQTRVDLKEDPNRITGSAHTLEKELPVLERIIGKTLPLKPDTAVKYVFAKTP